MNKLRVGVLGATGMVGQQFVTRLAGHPLFSTTALAASARSAGRTYADAVEGRWSLSREIPEEVAAARVAEVSDLDAICAEVDFVFCALSTDKETTRRIEEDYARREIPVISANSAHRWVADVPVLRRHALFKGAAVLQRYLNAGGRVVVSAKAHLLVGDHLYAPGQG